MSGAYRFTLRAGLPRPRGGRRDPLHPGRARASTPGPAASPSSSWALRSRPSRSTRRSRPSRRTTCCSPTCSRTRSSPTGARPSSSSASPRRCAAASPPPAAGRSSSSRGRSSRCRSGSSSGTASTWRPSTTGRSGTAGRYARAPASRRRGARLLVGDLRRAEAAQLARRPRLPRDRVHHRAVALARLHLRVAPVLLVLRRGPAALGDVADP